ncbi:sulfatase-like hydrolase/transferase [Microbacterium sp. MPKO10]|uniref:sulfatase-like hydrolase/transferase n=1 Tax=Microbacterium sp. MPKO10 TaxID=2989818 RepID=UPI002235567B|nr:sulfatase-like hydrolase/transferase [Microbacterium sp. MPKO10]MCW4460025.1 sulfatase-like hydrolase/transferase [Microbacterium sp. MPKO10]
MTRRHPNIVVIQSDDQGPWALGCAGNPEIKTPVLDALAERGTRLSRFFCASPVCSPARASLLTGQIPSRHGVHDYLDGAHAGPESRDYLDGQPTFTDALAEAGYRLGLSGKWHLGASDVPRRGFVHWFALEGGGSPYSGARMYRDGVPEDVDGYLTDVIADDAIDFIDAEAARRTSRQSDHEPFFLALNFTAPHKPFAGQHPKEFTEMYRDCAFESCPQEEPHPWQPTVDGVPIGGEADAREALIGYFAAVTAMDAAIGRFLDRLTAHGLDDDTIVVFASDNGFNCGHHGIWGKGNGTFPQNMYDESVMVPFIIAHPHLGASGRVIDDLLSGYDVAATLLDLAGLDGTAFEEGPGQSFAQLLRGEPGRERAVVVHDEYGPVRMIRTAERKYVHRYPHGPHEYYDLVRDPGERENLVDDPDHVEDVKDLRAQLDDWFTAHGDAARDGARLPVAGAGQTDTLDVNPLASFTPPNWDGTPAATRRRASA